MSSHGSSRRDFLRVSAFTTAALTLPQFTRSARAEPGLGADGGTFQRIERDIDLRAGALRRADLFADEQHRCFVALTLADDDGAVHVEFVERGAHGFDGGVVGSLFIAPPDQRGRADGRSFGHTDHFKDKNAIEDLAGGRGGHGNPCCGRCMWRALDRASRSVECSAAILSERS